MSVHTIERILWEMNAEPERAKVFLDDPDAYLSQFQLTAEEYRMVRKMDFRALDAYGVSNLLTMMVWPVLNGANELMMFDYLRQLNHGKLPNNFQMPGWQFAGLRSALWVLTSWNRMLGVLGLKKRLN